MLMTRTHFRNVVPDCKRHPENCDWNHSYKNAEIVRLVQYYIFYLRNMVDKKSLSIKTENVFF